MLHLDRSADNRQKIDSSDGTELENGGPMGKPARVFELDWLARAARLMDARGEINSPGGGAFMIGSIHGRARATLFSEVAARERAGRLGRMGRRAAQIASTLSLSSATKRASEGHLMARGESWRLMAGRLSVCSEPPPPPSR